MELTSAQDALAALSRKTGLEKLAFDRDGCCHLVVGDDLDIEIVDGGADKPLRLNAILRDLRDADAGVLQALLSANHNGTGTGLAALAIDPATAEIVLTQPVVLRHMSEAEFGEIVDTFVRYAAFWREHAATLVPSETMAPMGAAAARPEIILRP